MRILFRVRYFSGRAPFFPLFLRTLAMNCCIQNTSCSLVIFSISNSTILHGLVAILSPVNPPSQCPTGLVLGFLGYSRHLQLAQVFLIHKSTKSTSTSLFTAAASAFDHFMYCDIRLWKGARFKKQLVALACRSPTFCSQQPLQPMQSHPLHFA